MVHCSYDGKYIPTSTERKGYTSLLPISRKIAVMYRYGMVLTTVLGTEVLCSNLDFGSSVALTEIVA